MSRYDLKYPLRYTDPPNRKPLPYDEDVDSIGQGIDESMLIWGAKRAKGAPAFVPVLGQKTMLAEPPNVDGIHKFQRRDEYSKARNYNRYHWWYPVDAAHIHPTGIYEFADKFDFQSKLN